MESSRRYLRELRAAWIELARFNLLRSAPVEVDFRPRKGDAQLLEKLVEEHGWEWLREKR
jgi:hypothetical protein